MSATNPLWADGRPGVLDAEATSAKLQVAGTQQAEQRVDVYFSADVETDGPVPGPYSMLSLAGPA